MPAKKLPSTTTGPAVAGPVQRCVSRGSEAIGRYARWTPEEDEALRRGYAAGHIAELASALGRRYESVKARAARLGLQTRRLWTEEERELVRAHYRFGNAASIAKALGRTTAEVQQAAWRMGVVQKHDSPTKRCPKCGEVKLRDDYYRVGYSQSGRQLYSTYCMPCSRARAVRDDMLAMQRDRRKKACHELTDLYVRSTLGLTKPQTPDELLEMKRQQLLTRRLARQLKKASHESSQDPD